MNIVIIGQGAIGLLWYAHLQSLPKSLINLSLLTSKQALMPNNNFAYTHFLGLSELHTFQTASTQHIRRADVILLCVKAYQVKQVIAELAPLISSHSAIILAHNGMGTLTEIQPFLAPKQIIMALLTTHGCSRVMSTHIIHTGLGETHLGLLQGSFTQQKLLTSLLNQALPKVYWQKNIIEKQWIKLAINCVINPITALENVNNGELAKPYYQKQITALITEIVKLAKTEQQILSPLLLTEQVLQVAKATAKNCSSMRADILAKRPTEINYINGYIHYLGIKHQIKTPENTRLWQAINAECASNE